MSDKDCINFVESELTEEEMKEFITKYFSDIKSKTRKTFKLVTGCLLKTNQY